MIGMHLGPRAYWTPGWLLTIVAIYVGTQYARNRGVVAPVVPGGVAVVVGVVLAGSGSSLRASSVGRGPAWWSAVSAS